MVTRPKISMITAVLNGKEHIEETINSVISQGYPNIEYIIIDGGSKDGTLDVIYQYESYIDKWVSEADKGISDAFNKGIKMASGEIIGIISADDYLLPGTLERVASTYEKERELDVIFGNAVFIEPFNQLRFIVKPDTDLKALWKRQALKHVATFVAKKTYDNFGLFDLQYRFAMDHELILRFYLKGAKFYYIDEPLAAFRTGGLAISNPYKASRETCDITLRYGHSPFKAYPNYWYKVIRQILRKAFYRSGFAALLNIYRKITHRFSIYESNIRD